MRFLLGMCALFTLPLWANTQVTTKIHDIDHGDHITDEALVFLTSGQVAKLNLNDTELLNRLNDSLQKREWITLELNDQREIIEMKVEEEKNLRTEPDPVITPEVLSDPSPETVDPTVEPDKAIDPLSGYNASVVTESKAKQLFREARHASKEETQCFNRAHIWTYEWRVKHNIYSKKVWIYFTRKYIRRYNFEWWFHVSPMVDMIVNGEIKERVMDRKYSNGPRSIQNWANIFLSGDPKCPTVKHYSEHANYPESGWCFIQKSPMYYYQPVDLEFLDKFGTVRSSWREADVRGAYAEAFDIYP